MSTSPRGRLAGMAAVWLALLCCAPPAFAHAVLISVNPLDGAVVQDVPTHFVLTFNEPVSPLAIALVTPDGQRHDRLETVADGTALVVALPASLSSGTHVVSWRAASADGHPASGVTSFAIGSPSGGAPRAGTQSHPAVAGAISAARLVLYLALFFGVGSAVFAALVAPLPRAARRLAGMAMVWGLFAAPISLGLHGADALGLGLADLFGGEPWKAASSTSFGMTVAGCLAALALAGSSLVFRGRPSSALALAALLLTPLSLTLSGHAATAEPQWITRPALFLHITGIVFWTGALLPLLILLREGKCKASVPLARFSEIVPYPVSATLLSGIALAAIQLGPRPEVWLSSYGAILAGKLCLLLVLFGLAAWNRFGLTQAVLDDDAVAARRLRMSVGIEVALMFAILALVAGWRLTPPPRALAEPAREASIEMRLHLGAVKATIAVTPGRVGSNALAVHVTDSKGAPLAPLAVSVAVSSPALGLEPLRRQAEPGVDDIWHVSAVPIPLAGEWQVELAIRRDRFELLTMTESLRIP